MACFKGARRTRQINKMSDLPSDRVVGFEPLRSDRHQHQKLRGKSYNTASAAVPDFYIRIHVHAVSKASQKAAAFLTLYLLRIGSNTSGIPYPAISKCSRTIVNLISLS